MKQIKIHGVTVNAEEVRRLIADLQAQLDAPEPVEFWEGQLLQHNSDRIIRYKCEDRDGTFLDFDDKCWFINNCRPLQDPLVLQFKPHKPGDPMPCGKNELVLVKTVDGRVERMLARNVLWTNGGYDQAIGWMPADGWGRSA